MDNENTAADNDTTAPKKSGKLFGALIFLVAIGLGLFIAFKAGALDGVKKLFGPPQITSSEKFKNDSDATFDHSKFDEILKAHVDGDGWVDYAAIKNDVTKLDEYIESIKEADIDKLGRDARLAFLINSYNAFTIKLLVENFPVGSIKDIPAADRWDAVRWDLAGEVVSLGQIENEHIRPNFKEPRIHFSLVCGAIGCPPLRNEAYMGKTLEQQLTSQSTYVHDHATWFKYDKEKNEVSLTKLYDWYGGDFEQADGTIFKFIRNHSDKLKGAESPTIVWLNYDWDINDVKNRAPR